MSVTSISESRRLSSGLGNGRKKSARATEEVPGYLGESLKASEGHVVATILLVLANRGAIFFGMPRNGNAVLIRAWIGGEQFEDYCASDDEVQRTLDGLRDTAEAAMLK